MPDVVTLQNGTVTITESPTTQAVVSETNENVSIYEGTTLSGGGGDKNFQAALNGQTDITITHNLSKYPSVTVFDSAGDEVEGDYQHISMNSTRLLFSSGFSGKAIFN